MEEKKYNILIVHNYYQIPGGEDTVVANERKMLEDHGHRVIFYSRNNTEIKEMSGLKKLGLPFTTIFSLRTYREIKRLIRQEKVDIVHVHNTMNLISPAVYYAAISCKTPVVQTVHNFRLLCPGAAFYRDGHICEDCVQHGLRCAVKHSCYRGSRAQTLICVVSSMLHRLTGVYGRINYICLTDFNKEKLLNLKHVRAERIFVKPNFTYEPSCKNENSIFYLFIGRIEDIKGPQVLVDAFKRMPERTLKIAGTGPKLDYFKQQGIGNIEFLGFQKRDKLQQLLRDAKAVVVTSQCYETFGMIVIEAFASGVPVIVGDIGNIGSLVDNRVNGIKFKYNSYEALIQAVEEFDTLDRDKLRENAYRKYKEYFSQEKNYELLMGIYKGAAREKKKDA